MPGAAVSAAVTVVGLLVGLLGFGLHVIDAAHVDIATDDAQISFGSTLDAQLYRTGKQQLTLNASLAVTGTIASTTIATLQAQVASLQASLAAILLTAPLTVYVGPTRTYTTIPAAMAAIGKYIHSNTVTITIKVDDGTYTLSSPMYLQGLVGSATVAIVGNEASPSSCVLQTVSAWGNQNVVTFAEPNASFITFGGFTLLCTNPGTCNVGLVAQFGAMLYIPPNSLVLSGMNYGLYVSAFSMVQGQGISFVNSQNYGVAVAENAYAYVPDSTFTGPTIASSACVGNFFGVVDITGSTLSYCLNGIYCSFTIANNIGVPRSGVTFGTGITNQVNGGPC